MPEAVKEGGVAGDVAVPPEDTVPPPPVDLATGGVIEVKPPPDTEPSLPADHKQNVEADEKMVETAPDIKDPSLGTDKTDSTPTSEALNETKAAELSPKEELDEMILKGRGLLTIKRDCYAAAEVLSKACEKSSEIYGELSENCGELYYLYGCSMLECGKSENNVLGEGMKNKESEEGADGDEDEEEEEVEETGDDDGKDEKSEAMEVDESEEGASSSVGTSNGAIVKDDEGEGDDTTKDEEDDDSSLKVAWEMFELAKVAYSRSNHKDKLADTFMKLGEVGIESGHPAAMEDMLKALDIRQQLFPNSRLIAETHFNIGLGYSMFEMFDEAITHFEKSKSLLEEIIVKLENAGDDKSVKEAKEIKDVLPDLKDKIQDMVDSKRDKRKEVEEALNGSILAAAKQNGPSSAGTSSESDKPTSNISHLIKRKRKIDEVTSDLPNKATEEPKRKVKALDKEPVEEQRSEIDTSEQKKNSDHESSNQEESMEMEEMTNTDFTKNSAEDHSQPLIHQQSQSKTESKKDDSESDVISNSMDCESTETDKEVPVKVECEQTFEKLSENEEKKVDSTTQLEEKEIKSESAIEIVSESLNPVSTEENSQSAITNAAVQDEIKKPLPQEGSKNDNDLSANAVQQKCSNEKNLSEQEHKESKSIENSDVKSTIQATADIMEPNIAKEPSLKENSKIKVSDVLKEPVVVKETSKKENDIGISSVTAFLADEKTKTEVLQIQTGIEKADTETESNQGMKKSVNVESTTDTSTLRNIESEQVDVRMEVVESQMTELETTTTSDTIAATDSIEVETKAQIDTKAEADLSHSDKRETIESSEKEISTEIVSKQPCLDNMEIETTTKDTDKINEPKEMGSETNAAIVVNELEAMETIVSSSSAHEKIETTCEIPDSQAKNETTNLHSSSEKAVDESEMKSLTETADVKTELQPPKVTAEATLNENSEQQPSALKEMEAPSKTSECTVEELATETSESKETENLINIESKPDEKEASSSAKSVEDENVNGTESPSLSTISSKISLEENSVTNGCKEDHPLEEVTSNVETPVVAKELGKEEIPTSVVAE